MGFMTRAKHAWNAFVNNRDPTLYYHDVSANFGYHRPDMPRFTRGNERTIVTAIYNRIALDAAQIDIRHVRLDDNKRYLEDMNSSLNSCLSLEANIDQTSRAFIHDAIISMFDEGVVALVPIETSQNPWVTDSYEIYTMRTGKIVEWKSNSVKVKVYNERTGQKEDIALPKRAVAIIENPFYSVMNEPSSTLQRLVRKLALLDAIDEQSGSGKLDLIIQLPYAIKSDARRQQAEQRRKDIEMQLAGSKFGIAYADSTERITQLNRPVENNLMKQIEYLTNTLYGQLSVTQAVLDGTADEKTMLNYYSRTIEPILSAFADEMKRKFLTKTARSQNQSIEFFRDPFKLTPAEEVAKLADTMTRNEIMSKNEIRQIIGMKPSDDPKADMLINSNLNQSGVSPQSNDVPTEDFNEGGEIQNG